MKLIEAIHIIQRDAVSQSSPFIVYLAVGYTALHLKTFLHAHLVTQLVDRKVECVIGRYGDIVVSLECALEEDLNALAASIEWPDLDPRLGYRRTGGWTQADIEDATQSVHLRLSRILELLTKVAQRMRVSVCLPTLPLPPVFPSPPAQAGSLDLALRQNVLAFAQKCETEPNISVVNSQYLDSTFSLGDRHDIRSDLANDFPFRVEFASTIANALSKNIAPCQPMKGLITDLDDTLWRGLVGEVGIEGITWDGDHSSQGHALYQQMLSSLSSAGVLIGVASKNDLNTVEAALALPNLHVRRSQIFPVEASWGHKSDAIARILKTWNISADSVAFIDDNDLELAEVAGRIPNIKCIKYPTNDDVKLMSLLVELRQMFGKERIGEEDRLRLASIRDSAALVQTQPHEQSDLLRSLGAVTTFDFRKESIGPRALELINKTNQFNLNGQKLDSSDWNRLLESPNTFLVSISYADKFGSLGVIAVLVGTLVQTRLVVQHWVMSCRAFSRRIEFRTMAMIFEHFSIDRIQFEFKRTGRNGPLVEFFGFLLVDLASEVAELTRDDFEQVAPDLYDEVVVYAN